MIEAFIDCRPPTATAQHKSLRVTKAKKTGKQKVVFFETGDVEEARKFLTKQLRRYAPAEKMIGSLKFTCTWTFYWTLRELAARKRGKLLLTWVPKTTWPDGDNLAKMVKDVMTDLGYWNDDAQVTAEYYRRGRGDRPGIHFRIEPYVVDYVPPEGAIIEEVEL